MSSNSINQCSVLLDESKQAKLQSLQNPSETDIDNLNNVKRETSRTSRKERGNMCKENLKNSKQTARVNLFETCIEA
jgi:hypothetical protein